MAVKHPEFVLAGAVAVCLPMVPGLLKSEISVTSAATRFLIALVVCWVLGSVLGWVVRTYGEQARRAEIARMLAAEAEATAEAGAAALEDHQKVQNAQ